MYLCRKFLPFVCNLLVFFQTLLEKWNYINPSYKYSVLFIREIDIIKFTDDNQMNFCAVIGAREGKMQANKQINTQCCIILPHKSPHTSEQFD